MADAAAEAAAAEAAEEAVAATAAVAELTMAVWALSVAATVDCDCCNWSANSLSARSALRLEVNVR